MRCCSFHSEHSTATQLERHRLCQGTAPVNGNVIESSVTVFGVTTGISTASCRIASFGHVNLLGHLDVLDCCILSLASPPERFLGTSAGGTLSLHTGTSTTCRWFAPGLLPAVFCTVLHLNDHVDNILLVQEIQELRLRGLADLQDRLRCKTESQHVARLTCPSLCRWLDLNLLARTPTRDSGRE